MRRVCMLWLATMAPAGAATLCVNPAGTGGCTKTIGAAVQAAAAGDTVEVAAGVYKETVTISQSVMLFGANPATTIIDATSLSRGIYVDGLDNAKLSGVVISGFTVQNANFEGIAVTNATNVLIMGNTLTGNNKGVVVSSSGSTSCPGLEAWETNEGGDCGEAIHFSGVSSSTILNNTISNNSGGILMSDDTGATTLNTIAGNTVTNNVMDCGITLASHVPAASTGSSAPLGVYNNSVIGNTATGNGTVGEGAGVGIFASAPGTMAYANLVANNLLTGNGIPGVSIHGHAPRQVLDGNMILGNTLSGNGADLPPTSTPGTTGIDLYSVSAVNGTLIAGNTITNEAIGVSFNAPGSGRVQNNVLSVKYGVYNLGAGSVTADNNWWGCAIGPTAPIAALVGCGTPSGGVTINSWMSQAPSSK